MANPEELLSRLINAIDEHRAAKRRWEHLDMRRQSDKLRRTEISERFISSVEELSKAEIAARLHITAREVANG